jgi:DNA segregation ATPase FtsK/SpoIIIE, S-DNA-T family
VNLYDYQFTKVPALLPIRKFSEDSQYYKSGHIAFYSGDDNSRKTALVALQSIAVRIISSFPLRKLKGIFIDPVVMGDTFPFGTLDNFISDKKTYTRADDIQEQLRALTNHIEQVIQNYLATNFNSIEEYNVAAGAIAEPYRYLFIADFPTGFNNQSLEDLKSILLNGPKTGVYVILHIDETLDQPRDFNYQVFADYCLIHEQNYCTIESLDLKTILDQPPTNEQFNSMAEVINKSIIDLKVDTVDFAQLYPENDWCGDSRKEIRSPIGLMGAMNKLEFWFGENPQGTIVSNGLLAGKPGSGKSFTLHGIILSLAMQYSPDELELYLLDFKQGVEFQI